MLDLQVQAIALLHLAVFLATTVTSARPEIAKRWRSDRMTNKSKSPHRTLARRGGLYGKGDGNYLCHLQLALA
ncbi:MAG: hypothetical protein ACM3SS_14635, partial [Rhodospirillaceae bacterium]